MNVTVNGEPHETSTDELTLAGLLDELNIEKRSGMAVAVNSAVVPKSRWDEAPISDGDAIEIVRATQGG